MIINEWQLGDQLNQALGMARPADFRLWLAMLSPAIEEQAEFCWPDEPAPKQADLRRVYQLAPERDFALNTADLADLAASHQAFLSHGLADWRLRNLLRPAPQVIRHDAKKLPADVEENLSLHGKRKVQHQAQPKMQPDATLLYDVLQQLNPEFG
jgi:hypothetical protein